MSMMAELLTDKIVNPMLETFNKEVSNTKKVQANL